MVLFYENASRNLFKTKENVRKTGGSLAPAAPASGLSYKVH
jgi:hypothetical protein